MQSALEFLQEEAKRRFLGYGGVIGVGISRQDPPELVFLLETESSQAKPEILDWARQHTVRAQFLVTGRIRAGKQAGQGCHNELR